MSSSFSWHLSLLGARQIQGTLSAEALRQLLWPNLPVSSLGQAPVSLCLKPQFETLALRISPDLMLAIEPDLPIELLEQSDDQGGIFQLDEALDAEILLICALDPQKQQAGLVLIKDGLVTRRLLLDFQTQQLIQSEGSALASEQAALDDSFDDSPLDQAKERELAAWYQQKIATAPSDLALAVERLILSLVRDELGLAIDGDDRALDAIGLDIYSNDS